MDSETKYQPKFGRVIIKREVTKKTSGGIIIPDNIAKRHASLEGVIIGLGETAGWVETFRPDEFGNVERIATQTFKIGDKVLFGRHAGAWIDASDDTKDDGTLFICQDEDILAVINQ